MMKYFFRNKYLSVFLVSVGFSSCLLGREKKEAKNIQPNLVFIFADQYRRASLGFLNEDPVSTPNLDKLAQDGVFFSRAVSNHPRTHELTFKNE
jgi:hypothetical protein